MKATELKVGEVYAYSESRPKGAKNLLNVSDTMRVRVDGKNAGRWAENGDNGYGCDRNDGIKFTALNFQTGEDVGRSYGVGIARHFLMPWDQYEAGKAEERRAAQEREDRRREEAKALETRQQKIADALHSYGLNVSGNYGRGESYFDALHFNMTFDDMEKLLGAISERVYELVSQATSDM